MAHTTCVAGLGWFVFESTQRKLHSIVGRKERKRASKVCSNRSVLLFFPPPPLSPVLRAKLASRVQVTQTGRLGDVLNGTSKQTINRTTARTMSVTHQKYNSQVTLKRYANSPEICKQTLLQLFMTVVLRLHRWCGGTPCSVSLGGIAVFVSVSNYVVQTKPSVASRLGTKGRQALISHRVSEGRKRGSGRAKRSLQLLGLVVEKCTQHSGRFKSCLQRNISKWDHWENIVSGNILVLQLCNSSAAGALSTVWSKPFGRSGMGHVMLSLCRYYTPG